jgi:hypothetical protein
MSSNPITIDPHQERASVAAPASLMEYEEVTIRSGQVEGSTNEGLSKKATLLYIVQTTLGLTVMDTSLNTASL